MLMEWIVFDCLEFVRLSEYEVTTFQNNYLDVLAKVKPEG